MFLLNKYLKKVVPGYKTTTDKSLFNMVEICNTCQKRESRVLCSNCKEHNCGAQIGCCFTFIHPGDTMIIVCHSCYNNITSKLVPYSEISDKIRNIKKKATQKYFERST